MNRKAFIHTCGAACVTGTLVTLALQSCGTQKAIPVTYQSNQLLIPVTALYTEKNGEKKYKRSVVIRHDKLDFPVVIFRDKENNYKAFLLRCTHQGNELNVQGDIISCHAHGSEFGTKGEVLQGPAETSLKSYPVTADAQFIYIRLV